MNEDEYSAAEQARMAEAEAERIRQEAEDAVADPAAQVESIRQSNLIYGGLALEYDSEFRSRFRPRKAPDA